jgi:hypothetical protein
MRKIQSNPENNDSNNSSYFDFNQKLVEYSINASSFSSSQLSFCNSPLKNRMSRSKMLSVNSFGSNEMTEKMFQSKKKTFIIEN